MKQIKYNSSLVDIENERLSGVRVLEEGLNCYANWAMDQAFFKKKKLVIKIEVLSTIGHMFESPSPYLYFILLSWLIWIKKHLNFIIDRSIQQKPHLIQIKYLVKLNLTNQPNSFLLLLIRLNSRVILKMYDNLYLKKNNLNNTKLPIP